MTEMLIAIDPGKAGGIALLRPGASDPELWPMPQTEGDILRLFRTFYREARDEGCGVTCVLEQVGGFVAGRAQPGSAMFRFGENFGFLKGVIQGLDFRLEMVRPQVWQKPFGLGTASGCASHSVWKNKLKAEAQRRYPRLTITQKTADAVLLLDWRRGVPPAPQP